MFFGELMEKLMFGRLVLIFSSFNSLNLLLGIECWKQGHGIFRINLSLWRGGNQVWNLFNSIWLSYQFRFIWECSFAIIYKNGLSYIASAIGNPLYTYCITIDQQHWAFAKIYVEVDASVEIPHSIEVRMHNGSFISITVEVPWCLQKFS